MIHRALAVAFLFVAARALAAENPYDVFAKTVAPFVSLLAQESRATNRALSVDVRVLEATGLPPGLIGSAIGLQVQYPDKLLLRGPVLGQPVTLCRNGQELWAAPGAQIEALLARADLPKAEKKYRLEDFALPIPEKQLVFLPVLFQITDAGEQLVETRPCRVLDVRLMPELARSLGVEQWSGRLWVKSDYTPVRLELKQPGWRGVFAFDQVEFRTALPASTWAPTTDDILKISPQKFKQLLDAAAGLRREARPKVR